MDSQLPIIAGIAVTMLLVFGVTAVVLVKSIRDVPSGMAMVIRSSSGQSRVVFGRAVVIPFVQTAELLDISPKRVVIERNRYKSIRCADDVRICLTAVFVVRVNATSHDVERVRQRLSAPSLASPDFIRDLFTPRFTQALEQVVARRSFAEISHDHAMFVNEIIDAADGDLDGFVIEGLSVTNIEKVD